MRKGARDARRHSAPPGSDETCLSSDVAAFLAARGNHDIDGLMVLMSKDCVLDVTGPVPLGAGRYEGRDAVRAAYSALFETFPDAQWAVVSHAVGTSTSSYEWTFRAKRADGTTLASAGHDVLVFSEGQITVQTSRGSNLQESERFGTPSWRPEPRARRASEPDHI